MNALNLKLASVLSVAVLAGMVQACAGANEDYDAAYDEMDLGQTEQGVMSCTNPDGTNSLMAALAVATAQELKRWAPSKDFVVFGDTGGTSGTSGLSETSRGPQQAIKLTATGKARCADGKCAKVQALLDMQYDQANNKVKFPGGIVLSPAALRSRLVAKLREQITCEKNPVNGGNGNCPVEEHQLTFQKASKGSCDTNFFFKATSTTGAALKYPAQLKNKLIWVDQTNPYVAFQASGDVISIDPTYGLNEDSTNSAGSCTAACTKVSTTNVAGQCCSCNGATKVFAKATWNASTYLCQ
jgi:hypothetical protein